MKSNLNYVPYFDVMRRFGDSNRTHTTTMHRVVPSPPPSSVLDAVTFRLFYPNVWHTLFWENQGEGMWGAVMKTTIKTT